MPKISPKNIFHSIGIMIWLIIFYTLYRVLTLDLIPWLHYLIITAGPGIMYISFLFDKKRNIASYSMFSVCSIFYVIVAFIAVKSTDNLLSYGEILLIPLSATFHFVLYNNFKCLSNLLRWVEISLFLISFLLCVAVVLIEANYVLYYSELVVLIGILVLKTYNIFNLKNLSITKNS